MPHVNRKKLARPDELETDLLDRRTRAETEGWGGEIEGIDMRLTFLRAKREDSRRRLRRPGVDLGIPAFARVTDQEEKPKWHLRATCSTVGGCRTRTVVCRSRCGRPTARGR
jgi:hypothetical protein